MLLTKQGNAAESSHYNIGSIQPIDLIVSQELDFCEGNVVKYTCRAKHKGTALQDYLKAKQYLDWLIEIQIEKDRQNAKNSPNTTN